VGPRARSSRLRAGTTALALVAALALAAGAAAALPREGVLVPGRKLAGVAIGMSKADIKLRWGTRFGRCRDCAVETWYYTYRPFEPQGAAVGFRRGRVTQVYTLWQPPGWRTPGGLELGDSEAEVTSIYGALIRRRCIRYSALLLRSHRAQTAFYVFEGKLWGFGLTQPGASPCL
jgi:hypothetical protein